MAVEYPPQYIQPGQKLTVGDVKGNQVEIIGVNHRAVLDFIRVFREWLELTNMPIQVSDESLGFVRRKLAAAFDALPPHVFRELERQDIESQIGGL